MFFSNQPKKQKEYYSHLLQLIGSLSKLFSDNPTPYLYYRIAEVAFCKAFEATDLSRSDVAVDASIEDLGIGLKTFMYRTGKSLEKIAEFNRNRKLYESFIGAPDELVRIISELRNKRIEYAMNLHGLKDVIYHCVVRKPGTFLIIEKKMDFVDVKKIKGVVKRNNIIGFSDNINEYSFNISKSTLFKRFESPLSAYAIPISIMDDPFSALEKLLPLEMVEDLRVSPQINSIILPLYSTRGNQEKYVPQKSALNQWNAGGRDRHEDEIYIRIPNWIHTIFPGFLPDRDRAFDLHLPNGSVLSAKTCQEASKKQAGLGKALMSNPNKDLGHWLLRDVLEVPVGKLVVYEDLEWTGIDSVELYKIDDENYRLNFKEIGVFEDFEERFRWS